MPKLSIRTLIFLVVWAWLSAGCQATSNPPSPATGSEKQTQPAIPAPTNQSTPQLERKTVDPAVEPCDRELQALAMRPAHIPDWDQLPIPACYQLSLELQPDTPGYQGTGTITFTNLTGQPLAHIVLRTYPNAEVIYGGSLQVSEAFVDGEPVQPEVILPDQTAVRLPLAAELSPGHSLKIDLRFEGRLPDDLADAPSAYGVYNASSSPRSLSLANWYPILAEWQAGDWQAQAVSSLGDAVVSTIALYEVRVHAPQDWLVVTSGREIEPGFFVTGPMRDFMLVASPEYEVAEQEINDLRLRMFSLPGGAARASEALQATTRAMELFEKRFGAYPYNELDIVSLPLNLALGVEYPGLFSLKDTLFDSRSDQPWLLNLVAAHEAAHQWWYALVGNDVLENPWQDEALATYSSLLYQEVYEPANYQGTLAAYQRTVDQVVAAAENPDFTRSVRAFADQPTLYGPLVYQRGALFYMALREEIGSQAFFKALQSYYQAQQYQLADPQTLLLAFENACDCDLDDFFARWEIDN